MIEINLQPPINFEHASKLGQFINIIFLKNKYQNST